MSQELFYTSAPRGLQPGSRGFCTVAATSGMAAALMEKLESLSGYRPLFPPLDAKSDLNPVVYSHLRLAFGAKTYSVLSRICSAGLDYTERTNKFAHHVVLDNGELPPGGPAWLMRQPGFMEAAWDSHVGTLPTGRVPPSGDSSPSVCKAWQSLTGDAGWAGVVGEAFTKNSGRPVYLLFEPGMELLPLMDEVLWLLPAEQRWQVTFSTYFTGLPQGVSCLWRGVPASSAEAKNAARLPDALILDLCRPMGEATGGASVEQARTGIRPSVLPSEIPALELTRESVREIKSREMARLRRQPAVVSPHVTASRPGLPEVTPSGGADLLGLGAPPPHFREGAKQHPRTSNLGVWFAAFGVGAAAGILLTLAPLTFVWFFSGYELVRSADKVTPQSDKESSSDLAISRHEEPNRQPEKQQPVGASNKAKGKSELEKQEKPANTDPAPGIKGKDRNSEQGPSKSKPTKITSEPKAAPPRVVYGPLPSRRGSAFGNDHGQTKLLSENLPLSAQEPVVLLHGSKDLSSEESKFPLIVKRRTSEAGVKDVLKDLAKFELRNGELVFAWLDVNESAKEAAMSLKQSVLEIGAVNKVYVALRKRVQQIDSGIQIQGTTSSYKFPLKWDENVSPRPTSQIYLDSLEIVLPGPELLTLHKESGKRDATELVWSDPPNVQPKDSKFKVERVSVKVLNNDEIVVELRQARPKEDPKKPVREAAGTDQVSQAFKALSAIAMGYNELIEKVGRELHMPEFSMARDVKPTANTPPLERIPGKLTLKSLALYVRVKDVRVDVYRVGVN
jgi:hypothetical protein